MDVHARRLAQRIQRFISGVSDPPDAFKARITVGGLVAELISHMPGLPREVWGDLTGLTDLQAAYTRFERHVNAPANRYVENIVPGAARRGTPVVNRRVRRAVSPKTTERRDAAR
jgi:hypothetical protein